MLDFIAVLTFARKIYNVHQLNIFIQQVLDKITNLFCIVPIVLKNLTVTNNFLYVESILLALFFAEALFLTHTITIALNNNAVPV